MQSLFLIFFKTLFVRKYLLLRDPQPLHANSLKKRADLFCGQEYFLHLLERRFRFSSQRTTGQ